MLRGSDHEQRLGGLTDSRRTPAAIEQRFEGRLRMICRVAVAHQPLSLLIHHRYPVEFVGELLRIQIAPEMTFVDRGLGAPRHQLPPILKGMHYAFTHRMPQAVVILERGFLQWAAAETRFTANPFQFFLEQHT